MSRKRLTQMFPFLLPLRRLQRKLFFYGGMRLDHNTYAHTQLTHNLPYEGFYAQSLLINEHSGQDIQYQYNKVFNLKLAADALSGLIIRPGETFSFYQAVRDADRDTPFKDGLNLEYGKIVASYGGGLCQISSLLYWLFLHTPMTVTERHGHGIESFPTTTEDLPQGTDATISEGWLDLKVRNDSPSTWQIRITFDDDYMYGSIFCEHPVEEEFEIYNGAITYYRRDGKNWQKAEVRRRRRNLCRNVITDDRMLYENVCQIGYDLPESFFSGEAEETSEPCLHKTIV